MVNKQKNRPRGPVWYWFAKGSGCVLDLVWLLVCLLGEAFQLARGEVVYLNSFVAQGIGDQQFVRFVLAQDGTSQRGGNQLRQRQFAGQFALFLGLHQLLLVGLHGNHGPKARSIRPTGSASSLPT